MRELDLLFEKFLATDFDALDEQQLLALEVLLAEPDQDILAWLSSSCTVPAPLDEIVRKIRSSLD